MSSAQTRSVQLCFGGTFDPVHNAHLRILWEASHALQAELVRLLPCHIPPHKGMPESSAEHRLKMLALALADQPDWQVDTRELERDRPSYTVDTLQDLRRDLGSEVALVWLLGMDSFASLDSWHRWQEIGELAHLIVVGRPGSQLPRNGAVAQWAAPRYTNFDALREQPSGHIAQLTTTPQDIASSELRAAVKRGLAPRYLVPDAVCNYIVDNKLYSQGTFD